MWEKVAVVSDAHSDRVALTAVLADIHARGITRIWSLGDLVDGSGGTEGAACLADARAACEIMLAGNHEFFLARQLLAGARRALTLAHAPMLLFGHTHTAGGYTMPSEDSQEAVSLGVRLGKTLELPERCALNPGAVCDPKGARWLELGFSGDGRRTATPRRAAMAGRGRSLRRPRADPPRAY